MLVTVKNEGVMYELSQQAIELLASNQGDSIADLIPQLVALH